MLCDLGRDRAVLLPAAVARRRRAGVGFEDPRGAFFDDDELLVRASAVLKSQGHRKLVPSWETRQRVAPRSGEPLLRN